MKVGIVIVVSVAIIYLAQEVQCAKLKSTRQKNWEPFKGKINGNTKTSSLISLNKQYLHEVRHHINAEAKVLVDVWFEYMTANNSKRLNEGNFFDESNPDQDRVAKLVNDINQDGVDSKQDTATLKSKLSDRIHASDVHTVNYAYKLFLSSFRNPMLGDNMTGHLWNMTTNTKLSTTTQVMKDNDYINAINHLNDIKDMTFHYIIGRTLDVLHHAADDSIPNGMNSNKIGQIFGHLVVSPTGNPSAVYEGISILIQKYTNDIRWDEYYNFYSQKFETATRVPEKVFSAIFKWTEKRQTFLNEIINYLGEFNNERDFFFIMSDKSANKTINLASRIDENFTKYTDFHNEQLYPRSEWKEVVYLLQYFLRNFVNEHAIISTEVFKKIKPLWKIDDIPTILNHLNELDEDKIKVLMEMLDFLSSAANGEDKEIRINRYAIMIEKCMYYNKSRENPHKCFYLLLKYWNESVGKYKIIRSYGPRGQNLEFGYEMSPKKRRLNASFTQ